MRFLFLLIFVLIRISQNPSSCGDFGVNQEYSKILDRYLYVRSKTEMNVWALERVKRELIAIVWSIAVCARKAADNGRDVWALMRVKRELIAIVWWIHKIAYEAYYYLNMHNRLW